MTMRYLALALLTVAFVVGTVMFGWWTVPVLGLVWGICWESPLRSGWTAGLSAMFAWAALLGWSATQGPIVVLSEKVAGVIGIPTVGLFLLTVGLAGVLAGSGAVFSGSVRVLPAPKPATRD